MLAAFAPGTHDEEAAAAVPAPALPPPAAAPPPPAMLAAVPAAAAAAAAAAVPDGDSTNWPGRPRHVPPGMTYDAYMAYCNEWGEDDASREATKAWSSRATPLTQEKKFP